MTTPRVLLIGYGSAGRGIHAPLLAAAGGPPSVVMTGDPGRAAQAEADLPGVRIAADLPTALESLAAVASGGPTLAVVASSSGAHEANALTCIAAGVPTVVDKPLAVDSVAGQRILDAAAAAGVPFTVFQNRRWDAEHRTLLRLLSDGSLGQVHRFERRWERWRPVPKDRWRENAPPEEGGGMLLDLGPHLVDSAVNAFGRVLSVHAETAAWTTRAEDEVFLSVQHAAGVRSHLGATAVAGAPGPRTRVLGSRGAYVVTEFEAEPYVFGFADAPGCTGWLVAGQSRTGVPTARGSHEDFYPAVFHALAAGDPVQRQAAMPVDPADAVHVLAVLDAARVSAAQGRVVRLTGG